jgi:membrane protease YdiL (CAAX protease family)
MPPSSESAASGLGASGITLDGGAAPPPVAVTSSVAGRRGVLHRGRLLWLRGTAWGLVLVVAIMMAALPVNLAVYALHVPRGSAWTMIALALALGLMLAVYGIAVRYGERRPADELAVASLAPEFGGGLAFGIAIFAVAMGVLVLGGWYTLHLHAPGPPWTEISMGLGAGTVEELVFRGVLMRLLWSAFGLRAALALSAVIFGAAHVLNPGHDWVGPLFIVFEAGIVLGGLYALTGRLWASIGAHAGWNFTQGYIFGGTVSGTNPGGHWLVAAPTPGAPALLTGGAFGPEGSLACLLVGTGAGVLVLVLAYRRHLAAAWAIR